MNADTIAVRDGYTIRQAKAEDAAAYYEQNYCPLDTEAARMTGCKAAFEKEEVLSFFERSLQDPDRCFFLIVAPDGTIIGESVINEIDRKMQCANFRICLYKKTERGKGLGTWATEVTRDFAFEKLHLRRLELDVYSFNPNAIKTYRKAGFRIERVLKNAVKNGENRADVVLMAISENEWKTIVKK